MLVNGFQYRRIDEHEFDSAKSQWNDLLKVSDANPLFVCWEWMHAWWKTWAEPLNIQLYIYFIYSHDQLVGILPLYTFHKRQGVFREFHFLGNAWGRSPTVRSEYIGPIFNMNFSNALNQDFLNWVKGHGLLDCFIVADCIQRDFAPDNATIRKADKGYRLKCDGNFDNYKKGLSAAVRLKVFNRVDYLREKYKSVEFGFYNLADIDLDNFFDQLNIFHIKRWGKPCFDRNAVEFHKRFIAHSQEAEPILSFIRVGDQLVSLSYNLFSNGVIYNIQSGYVETFDKKVALGALHFGFIIDFAFQNTHIKCLDFLAGRGKLSNYKASFRGDEILFFTIQIFSSSSLGNIYKYWMKLRSKLSFWRLKWITP
jgi:hypothetical protein